jgi:hypothetical protein
MAMCGKIQPSPLDCLRRSIRRRTSFPPVDRMSNLLKLHILVSAREKASGMDLPEALAAKAKPA